MDKKRYIKPRVERISLDNTISLMMVSTEVPDSGGSNPETLHGYDNQNLPSSSPLASPFGDSPYK
jgi:hypothetical protein